jgi:hypothetical protein
MLSDVVGLSVCSCDELNFICCNGIVLNDEYELFASEDVTFFSVFGFAFTDFSLRSCAEICIQKNNDNEMMKIYLCK